MGRPINPNNAGGSDNGIALTAYNRVGRKASTAANVKIIRQRGTNVFIVGNDEWQERMTLTNKPKSRLEDGEFMLETVNADGKKKRVTRILSDCVRLEDGTTVKWTEPKPAPKPEPAPEPAVSVELNPNDSDSE